MLPRPFFKVGPNGLFVPLSCSPPTSRSAGNRFSPLLHIAEVRVNYFLHLTTILALYDAFALLR
jgi:hypothetical protein